MSDQKIELDYKIQRLLSGSLLGPDEAHFSWNGTFSHAERQALRNGWEVKRACVPCSSIP